MNSKQSKQILTFARKHIQLYVSAVFTSCVSGFKVSFLSVGVHSTNKWEMISVRTFIKLKICAQSVDFSRQYCSTIALRPMASQKVLSDLKALFSCGVSAVQPKNLFRPDNVCIDEKESKIICNFNENRVTIDISSNRRCHLVGFGKAVYGMANELAKVLGERLESGIISVPLNIQNHFDHIQLPNCINVFEGAKDNLPDENAQRAAFEIVRLAKRLTKNDVLFVVISGGGSALLPLPCEGVTLDEKLTIIKSLASKGATITDINRVRIDLSQTKGGKLANCAMNAGTIITFIISDIIGDPIHLIASGPTVMQSSANDECSIDVLKRFDLWKSIPEHIQSVLVKQATTSNSFRTENVQNIIIANNEIAVNAIVQQLNENKLLGIVLSTTIEGDVAELSSAYFELTKSIESFKYGQIDDKQFLQQLVKLRQTLHIRNSFLSNIVDIVHQSNGEQIDFCVIGAGEPTVRVVGNGRGGRNQELAARYSQLSFDDNMTQDVLFLSAGTDGIDGEWSFQSMVNWSILHK